MRLFLFLSFWLLVMHSSGGTAKGSSESLPAAEKQAAPLEWPQITRQNKPWTRWWWLGNVADKRELSAELEKYQRAGLGGVEVTPIYGIQGYEDRFVNFLSPTWVEMLEHHFSVRRAAWARRRHMATYYGWPLRRPWAWEEDACKNLCSSNYTMQAASASRTS
jgi:hypothetical protein